MNEKKPRRLGTMFLALLACAGAVACAKSSSEQPTPQTPTAFAVHRYGTDGTPDTSFGTGGVVITDLDPAQFDFAVAVALQTGGNIIAAGQTVVNGQAAIALVRYLADGTLDTTGFGTAGTGGIVRTVVGTAGASSVAVQPDGKILVAATTFNSSTSTTGFALVRYNTDGTPDTSFGTNSNGIVIGPMIGSGSEQDLVSLALQPDGNIVVAGAASSGSFVLTRFTTTGTLDTTFNSTGTVTTPIGAGAMPPAIALQAGGKIIAAGAVGNFNTPTVDVALVRYNGDGSLDTSFGTSGIVTTDINSSVNYANAVAVQPSDGKIVVVGHANVNLSTGTSDIAVLRYNTDGTLDTSGFGAVQGFVVTDLGGFDNAFSVALQTDGKILVSGNSINTISVSLIALRYSTTGTLDPTFGTAGLVSAAPTGPSNVTSGNAVAVQAADGKIVVVGYD